MSDVESVVISYVINIVSSANGSIIKLFFCIFALHKSLPITWNTFRFSRKDPEISV